MPGIYDTDQGGFGGTQINSGLGPTTIGNSVPTGIDSSGQPYNANVQGNTINFLNLLNRVTSSYFSFFAGQKTYNPDTYKKDVLDLGKSIVAKSAANIGLGFISNFIWPPVYFQPNASMPQEKISIPTIVKLVLIVSLVFVALRFVIKKILD